MTGNNKNNRRLYIFVSLVLLVALALPASLALAGRLTDTTFGKGNSPASSAKPAAPDVSPDLVISQIYGAGGNAGATYDHDFIEIFNRGNTSKTVTNWSVQYAAATGTTWTNITSFSATIPPGGYFLIQEAGGANGIPLPTPDILGSISMAAAAGKVALVSNTTALTGSCPTGGAIVDFVGYGTTANCFEGGGAAPAPSTTNSDQRASNGCTDTDVNSSDFTAPAVAPRNSATAAAPCGPTATPTITNTPTDTPAVPPTETGTPTQTGTPTETGTPTDTRTSTNTRTETGTPTVTGTPTPNVPSTSVVISEFRVRGPNGATDEFVELYNLGNTTVDLSGWQIWGSNNAGTVSSRLTIANGVMLPPRYHFLAANSAGYISTPTPDATYTTGITDDGGIAIKNAAGGVVDMVGMSAGSLYKEGTPLPSLGTGNTNHSYERKPGGIAGSGQDTNDNTNDFTEISPSDPQSLSSAPIADTPTPTETETPGGPTHTETDTRTATNTRTPTITRTPSNTGSPTQTGTATPVPGFLSGTITDAISGLGIKASVQISGTGTFSQSMPLSGGAYAMTLYPGNYDLIMIPSGCYVGQTASVTITVGNTTTQNFSVARSGIDGGGYSCYEHDARSFVAAANPVITGTFDDKNVNFTTTMPINYYGTTYYTGTISSNGFISVGKLTTGASFANACMPSTSLPNGIVAPNWDDLSDTGVVDSGVYTSVTGTAGSRTFIVEWRKVMHLSDPDQPVTNTFELQIDEATGDIYYVYQDVNGEADGQESTVGIENVSGTIAKQAQCNTGFSQLHNFMWAGNSIRFVKGAPPTATSTRTATDTSTPTGTITPGGPTLTPTITPTVTLTPVPTSVTVVISEFRTRGPNGGNDEFIELYNLTASPINIGGYKINGSNASGVTGTRLTVNAGTMIPAHGHFLATNNNTGGYSGSVVGDQTYNTGIVDDGGIALLDGSNGIIDMVGMGSGSAYGEGDRLPPFADNANKSYERLPGGALGNGQDTNDNTDDFQVISPSDPQNLASDPTPGNETATPTATAVPCYVYTEDMNIWGLNTLGPNIGPYYPQSLTIGVGTTVRWTNRDATGHTATSDTAVWDSGTIAGHSAGGVMSSYSYTFNTPGTYPYHDTLNPSMTGTIVVNGTCLTDPNALVVHVTWTGRLAQPSAQNIMPMSIELRLISGGPLYTSPIKNTDQNGNFVVDMTGLAAGNYKYRAAGRYYLASGGPTSTLSYTGLSPMSSAAELGSQGAGNMDSDNTVGLSDFTLLKSSFGKLLGASGYDARADYDGNENIGLGDFTLLKGNFGKLGPGAVRPVNDLQGYLYAPDGRIMATLPGRREG